MSFYGYLKRGFLGDFYRRIRQWKKIIKIFLIARYQNYFKYSFSNLQEFAHIYQDTFIREEYKFISKNRSPIILDCGSHIGIPILYFKKKYPRARITAFEPNPKTFQLLQKNLKQNSIDNVVLVNAAVAGMEKIIPFYTAKNTHGFWSWGDSGIKHNWYNPKYYKTIQVPTVTLSSFINGPIDLIKLDIEWMETEVIQEIENKLHLVKEIVLEFHGGKANPVEKLLKLLKNNHFSYMIYQDKEVLESNIIKSEPYLLIIHAKNIKQM
jgi:FkbM family methyltransferase